MTLKALVAAVAMNNKLNGARKRVVIAQAILESARGESELAKQHNNYFGMKYRPRIAALATPVNYIASDGAGTYAKFATVEDAVNGYVLFIETGPYAEPSADTSESYLLSLVEGGYAEDPGYQGKVSGLFDEADNLLGDSEPVTVAPSNGGGVSVPRPVSDRLPKLAVIVGHNTAAQGASSVAPLNQSEFVFNSDVADLMEHSAAEFGMDVELFFRQSGLSYSRQIDTVYAAVDAYGADASIELHFNAATPAAVGTEVLHSGFNRSRLFAAKVQEELVDLFERTGSANRRIKEKSRAERGGRSLHAGKAPAILVEPFFGSSAFDCNLMDRIGKALLAESYLNAAAEYFALIRNEGAVS